jgi:1,4-alpha-glucan branching enzyme
MPTSHARDNLSADAIRILAARHHDPFSFLGRHTDGQLESIRAFIPGARRVSIADSDIALDCIDDAG